MLSEPNIAVTDAMRSLAFVGDLSRGQPIDHSLRTARLAALLAAADGADAVACEVTYCVALLRWAGCTANAAGFGELLGDDVAGRRTMAQALQATPPAARDQIFPLAQIHCEVCGDIAVQLGLPQAVEAGLRSIFETYNGNGLPRGLAHTDIPAVVYRVALAGDLEVLSRVHGLQSALAFIEQQGDAKYPSALVRLLSRHADAWLALLHADQQTAADKLMAPSNAPSIAKGDFALTLVADVVDLKLPWLAGHSRKVAALAQGAAQLQGLDSPLCQQLYGAGLIHGVGRAAIPNRIWNTPGRLDASAWEQVRLAPYWTWRAMQQIRSLTAQVHMASHAYERMDGTGYFRSLAGESLNTAQRTLAAAVAWTALRAQRPWRAALSAADAATLLRQQAAQGLLDATAVDAVLACATGEAATKTSSRAASVLTDRETEVLARISLGESNKEVARSLAVSPSTVRTHVESIFRKLQCSTRAAATLKAYSMGMI